MISLRHLSTCTRALCLVGTQRTRTHYLYTYTREIDGVFFPLRFGRVIIIIPKSVASSTRVLHIRSAYSYYSRSRGVQSSPPLAPSETRPRRASSRHVVNRKTNRPSIFTNFFCLRAQMCSSLP